MRRAYLDLVNHRGNGLLYDPDVAGALGDAVSALAADHGLRRDWHAPRGPRSLAGPWHAVGDALLGHYAAALRPAGPHPRARGLRGTPWPAPRTPP